MPLVEAHPNAIVSSASRFATMDISDFYLGANMPSDDTPPVKIFVDLYPAALLDELGLSEILQAWQAVCVCRYCQNNTRP